MCGIVGLFALDPEFESELPRHLCEMLLRMTPRGPDSSGLALWSAPGEHTRLSVLAPCELDWREIAARLVDATGQAISVEPHGDIAVLVVAGDHEAVRAAVPSLAPGAVVIGVGTSIEVFKHVGRAEALIRAYPVAGRVAHQGVGHTRMATESAVTSAHAHPFCPSQDLALVHNGSFSNHATIRRDLRAAGVAFDSDNDSEVAARLVAHRLESGADLGVALDAVLGTMDGFFTLLVGTATQFAVVRDAFACKPAVVAETDRYVAVASEYHALTHLPGIDSAEVWEPMPEEIHLWTREQPSPRRSESAATSR